jgi:nucleoside-diphosphate-sugar epimerase
VKIFIVGATGVLGRRLIAHFRERGESVYGLSRSQKNQFTIRSLGADTRDGDLFDVDSLARAAEDAHVIVHAATSIPISEKPKPEEWQMNDRIRREGTRVLAEVAARVGAKMFMVQSISWVARPEDQGPFNEDSPVHPDFITQSAADMEQIAREAGEKNGFHVAILRCGNFYAGDAAHTRYFGKLLAARKLPIIGKGDAVWSLVHADDAANAFVWASEGERSGVWHIVDNEPVVAGDYLRYFAEKIGAAEPRRVPEWLARLVAGSTAVDFMTASTRTSNDRFCREFGWSPRYPSYREGLDEVIAGWRAENFLRLGAKAAGSEARGNRELKTSA